jgi:hypothetical protein
MAGPLRGLPGRPLGSNPRGLSDAGFPVPAGFLRLVASGSIWLRRRGISGFGEVRALRLVASVLGGRWQNVGKMSRDRKDSVIAGR